MTTIVSLDAKDPFTAIGPASARPSTPRWLPRVRCTGSPFTGEPVWLITGYDEVRQALRDPRVVKSEETLANIGRGLVAPEVLTAITTHMLNSNAPDHTRLRRLVAAAFTRRRVEQLAPRIQQITDELLDITRTLPSATASPLPGRPAGPVGRAHRAGQPARPLSQAAPGRTARGTDLVARRAHARPGRASHRLGGAMRILLTCCPAYGHVNTMLPLAREARRAGHEVAIATGAELVPEIERRGFDTWLVGPSRAESDASLHATYPDLEAFSPEERMQVQLSGVFVEPAAKRAVELVPRAQEWEPNIVVHEVSELAGALAAARTGARHVVHGLGLMPPAQMWKVLYGSRFARMCWEWQLPELVEGVRYATYLDICPPSLRTGSEPPWPQIQPLRPAAGEPAVGERLPDAIADLPYPQTIHLTLGTIFHEAPGVLETAITGLRELPLNLVVTSGPDTNSGRFGPQPPHVLIEPYIPHSLLLPQCCLIVSHGGAGIMLGALAHGLPQLILPQGADQFMNAVACRSAGAALALTPEEFSAPAVAAAAERLITEPRFRGAAGGIQAEIDAMPHADTVLTALTAEEEP